MSGEIEVPETPNWLNDLEAKRERRLKVKLGHEAGAGAPCLKCGDKCPGLDLHFWRKACKICRCTKEEHDVPDDDVYGWAQFQLLGSKPNKIKTKIVLPGKTDEVELDWAPKGQKDIIDKYLKTLPPEALPVKGSQAAQERKQLLQKQIPIHDIDPSLCHELNEEEVAKMEEYIGHIKNSSVGVGQIVNLSSVINANIHNISPEQAHIIASHYSKGVPFSEIVKVQTGLAQSLENLALNRSRNLKNQSNLPNMQPVNSASTTSDEKRHGSSPATKFKDITHPWYSTSSPKPSINPRYSEMLQTSGVGPHPDSSIDNKLLQATNFNPALTPSQFLNNRTVGYRPGDFGVQGINPHQYASYIPGYNSSTHPSLNQKGATDESASCPGLERYGFENPYFKQKHMPGYSPSKNYITSEIQNPQMPKTVKDLMYAPHRIDLDNNASNYHPSDVLQTNKQMPSKQELLRGSANTSDLTNPYTNNYNTPSPGSRQTLLKYDSLPGELPISPHGTNPNPSTEQIRNKASQFDAVTGEPVPDYYRHTELGTDLLKSDANDQLTIRDQKPDSDSFPHANEFGKKIPQFDSTTGIKYPESRTAWANPSSNKQYVLNDQKPEQGSLAERIKAFESSDPKSLDVLNQSNSNKMRNLLTALEPRTLHVPENQLEPYMVNVGSIQDINPEIKAATTELNPGFDRDSVYSDSGSDFSPENIKEILGDIKLPDCHYCKKPFHESEFAVTIDRSSALFHAQCFRCTGCNQSLADNIYFYHKETDNVYCGRDYAKIKGYPRCSACDELIFTKEYCLAENATFHLKHFCCFQCDEPLAGQDYTLEEEKPYCLPCYETSKAAKCSACEKVIKPDERGCQLNDVHFHAEDRCFSCTLCSTPLLGKKLLLRNKKLFCSHACFNATKQ